MCCVVGIICFYLKHGSCFASQDYIRNERPAHLHTMYSHPNPPNTSRAPLLHSPRLSASVADRQRLSPQQARLCARLVS